VVRLGKFVVVRVDVGERERDVQRAERHDERRQAQLGDEPAVQQAKPGRHEQADDERERRRDVVVHGELGHEDGRQGHDQAAGKVDARGEDDERLADRQRAEHHHLLEDQREVRPGEEPVRLDREEDDGDRQRENRRPAGDEPRAQRGTRARVRGPGALDLRDGFRHELPLSSPSSWPGRT
jgi:hypothetical protein